MFLDVLRRRNPGLIAQAIALHQAGRLPANSTVIDCDAVERNARGLREEADRLGLKVFAMTKQMGRNPGFCAAVRAGGITHSVAVDMQCARACHGNGLPVGHIGHLVQIPRAEADAAARLAPDYWTVFDAEKAAQAAAAADRADRQQKLLARIQGAGDIFYRGHEGGFPADDIVAVAAALDRLPGATFAGITSFPALLFDLDTGAAKPTPNLATLRTALDRLRQAGWADIEVNAPGTTSATVLRLLREAGATQVEPGHGLTGTTPLHVVADLPEDPAVVYVTEISHHHGGRAYCFGGGLYVDPVFPAYDVRAMVSNGTTQQAFSVEIPPPAVIDYYGMIDATPAQVSAGDTVVFGFRPQAFVTRANVVALSGIGTGQATIASISDALGRSIEWP